MAAAAVAGVRDRLLGGSGSRAHLSLARTAAELLPAEPVGTTTPNAAEVSRNRTPWGAADLLRQPPQLLVRGPLVMQPQGVGSDAPAQAVAKLLLQGVQPQVEAIHLFSIMRVKPMSTMVKSAS